MTALAPFIAFAHTLANAASAMLTAHATTTMDTAVKGDKTFVTSLDLDIEEQLRTRIMTAFPDHGIWGEEFEAVRPDATWVWTLDPIDGTMAFVAGMPVYSTLIALCRDGVPVVGVMNFPATGERWAGAAGHVSTRNGLPCRTRRGVARRDAILSASNPDFFIDEGEKRTLRAFTDETAWRVYGGAAMSYGRLACGRTDIALDASLKIYDYAPFIPIIEGAGGRITDWNGAALHLQSGARILAAGSTALHQDGLDLIQLIASTTA